MENDIRIGISQEGLGITGNRNAQFTLVTYCPSQIRLHLIVLIDGLHESQAFLLRAVFTIKELIAPAPY